MAERIADRGALAGVVDLVVAGSRLDGTQLVKGLGHVLLELVKTAEAAGVDDDVQVAKLATLGQIVVHGGDVLASRHAKAAKNDLCCLTMCQSDPMVIPYGGAEPFYGTNPIAFRMPLQGPVWVQVHWGSAVMPPLEMRSV